MIALSSIFEGIFAQNPDIISKADRIIMAVGWMYAHSSEFNHPLFSNPRQRRVIESIRKNGPLALSLEDQGWVYREVCRKYTIEYKSNYVYVDVKSKAKDLTWTIELDKDEDVPDFIKLGPSFKIFKHK